MRSIFITLVLVFGMLGSIAFTEERPRISLEDAVKIATKEVPGKVIEAEFEDGFYEIKIKAESGERIKVRLTSEDGTVVRKGKLLREPPASSRAKK